MMPYKQFPPNPCLQHLKSQAKDLLKALRLAEPHALQRIREFHPEFVSAPDSKILGANLALSDSQLVVAREYCFASWLKLRAAVADPLIQTERRPHHERIYDPIFRSAVDLIDAGELVDLRVLIQQHPELIRQRVFFDIGDYFGRPSLLEFVAENPIRHGAMPKNILAIARTLLELGALQDPGSVNATLALVSSGRIARECGFQIPLIELLCQYGAAPNFAMLPAALHAEFAAVERLIKLGAEVDLPVAACLGNFDAAKQLLGGSNQKQRHLAMALACQFGKLDVVKLLLDAGEDPNRFNPVGAHSHSTPLHQAALGGHLQVVELLIDRGANPNSKDILWEATPCGWARHGGKSEVEAYLRQLEAT